MEALDYLLAPNGDASVRADVVSMSMGGVASRAWAEVVNRAYEAGITLVTAAGNNFPLSPQSIVFPARFKRVIAACGVMANRHPYIQKEVPFGKMAGNFGPDSKMDTALAAFTPNMPWAEINCPGVIDMDGQGTSSATPQIAAAAALWLQKHKPSLPSDAAWKTVEAVRRALFSAAEKGGEDAHKYFGQGILRTAAALDVVPAKDLTMTPADSASFAFLKVLTGLGIAPPESEQMLALETTQLFHSDARLEETIPETETEAGRPELAQFFEAVIEGNDASPPLKDYLKTAYPRLFAAPVPGSAEQPVAAPWTGREIPTPRPRRRALRGYAFDPELSTRLETAAINEALFEIPWEDPMGPGPSGEYVEVVDHDPASGCYYAPVDLNERELLASDGLAPSEGNPKFHQQMVYAVSMRTISNFEQALGRKALWSPKMAGPDDSFYVQKLRIYPHALREKNAYYNPEKKALLFGYFMAGGDDPGRQYPGEIVFTCLSHDIVAHETTHALLDGMHRSFNQPSNPDQLAFHEAFADLVALFQHFSMPEVLEHQIRRTRGDLRTENLLGELAVQFGIATGMHGALRSAIGTIGQETLRWEKLQPDPGGYQRVTEPHARGALLVAAVFDAFLSIYQARSADLLRLATGGSGVLPEGAIHPDLADRLAAEAAKAAQHVLTICIRALDYCPPVDITFGDYLRALITADFDMEPVDERAYRVAFVEAFRRRGLYPSGLRTLSVDSLLWRGPEDDRADSLLRDLLTRLRGFADRMRYVESREEIFKRERQWRAGVHATLAKMFAGCSGKERALLARAMGLDLATGREKFEVHSLRVSEKTGTDGTVHPQILLALVQDRSERTEGHARGDVFTFTGGCTLIADQRTAKVKYFVTKNVLSQTRLETQRASLRQQGQSLAALYFGASPFRGAGDRFAMLHSGEEEDADA